MKDNINKDQIEGFRAKTRLFGHHAKGVNKAIDMITEATTKRVWYEVTAFHGTMFCGPDLDEAIELYNKL